MTRCRRRWLRAARAGADGVANLDGWLTTITSRVCLDMLRSRQARHEELAGGGRGGIRAAGGGRRRAGSADAGGPSRRRCWPTRSGWRCWSCSTGWRRPSGWRSCCTTCSGCRSRRSRGSPDAHPTPPGSSRAGPGDGCAARPGRTTRPASRGAGRRPPGGWPGSERSPRRSSPPPGRATATRCWPCSTRTSSCTRTRPRCRPAGRPSCGARRRSPTGRGCPVSGPGTRSSSSWTGCPASCTRRAARSRSCSPSATATTASPASRSSPTRPGSTRSSCAVIG